MNPSTTSSVEQLQVVGRFEGLRKILLSDEYADCLAKPLAHWALPTDRRLPLALMGRTLGDLLNTPFSDLSATPGIGQKKIRSFVDLLSRAASTAPAKRPVDLGVVPRKKKPLCSQVDPSNGFDPSSVSEVVWARWRATVVRRGLGGEALGRFAPSLKRVTRVIWNTPLDRYAHCTLGEIRAMKTYGEKRVRAILEVFHSIHELVAGMGHEGHLVVRIVPRLIDRVETWIGRALQTPGVPSPEETSRAFVGPLLEQIRIDATEQITRLAECRLGIHGRPASVRQAARSMGLTRARVYQLLNEINDIMAVRWPMGRHQVYELRQRLDAEAAGMADPPDLTQFYAAVELFYPGSRRGASGPLEPAAEPAAEPVEEEPAYELSGAIG
jgi:hypothetical protein